MSCWASDRGSSAANWIIDTTFCTTNLFTETSSANFIQPLCNLSRSRDLFWAAEGKIHLNNTLSSGGYNLEQVCNLQRHAPVYDKDYSLWLVLWSKTLKKEPNWQVKMRWKSEGRETCSVFNWGIAVKVWSEMAWKLPFTYSSRWWHTLQEALGIVVSKSSHCT